MAKDPKMEESELLEHIAVEHRAEVSALYAAFVEIRGSKASDSIDSFAHSLYERGLLSAEGLKEFMTYHELSVGELDVTQRSHPEGRYELMTVVGQGAMGEVYLGLDPSLRRTVAVKRAHADLANDPILLQRFLKEAQVTAQLDHPAIVPVYGLERDPTGALAYAMKFVRGVTLTRLLEDARHQCETQGVPDGAHALRARVELFLPVLNAVAYAHRRGVVHRDLKPDNIMVGSFGQVLVMDWGIARLLGRGDPDATSPPVLSDAPAASGEQPAPASAAAFASQPKLTLAGAVLGTPTYMSPEQANGLEVGPASDQYALGLILQEIVSLRAARGGDSAALLLVRAMRGLREPIVDGAERVPRELRAIIGKATAPEPASRYGSVAALADDLRRFLRDESIDADPDRGVRRLTRWVAKHRGLAAALGVAVAVLALALVMFFVWRGQLALVAEREAARLQEQAMAGLEALVDTQGKRMSEKLHRYEALLEGIASSASIVMRAPAPTSDVVAYRYADGKRYPAQVPSYAIESAAYGQLASLHADFSIAWGLDGPALRPGIDQLARLEPLLRSALLRSISEHARAMSFAEAEALVLGQGVPLVWTYLNTEDGLGIGMPGTWESYDSPGGTGYDHRREEWYRQARAAVGPVWTVASDESQFGLTVSCLAAVRDETGDVLGVAGVDIWLHRFIDELLEVPVLAEAGAEALLLDAHGAVIIRSRAKDEAKKLSVYAPVPFEHADVRRAVLASESSGRRRFEDGSLAIWSRLGSAGLTYLVIGPEQAMSRAVEPTAPQTARGAHAPGP